MLNFFSGNSSGEMAWVICRVLATGQELSHDELCDRLQPGTFVDRNETAQPAMVLKESLNLCKSLGLLEGSGKKGSERLRLIIDPTDVIDLSEFRTILRRRILGDLSHGSSDKNDGDLFKACSWLFTSDLRRPFGKWDNGGDTEQRITSKRLRPTAVSNSTQWRAFIRWSIFLGIAETGFVENGSTVLWADPRVALTDEIQRMSAKHMSAQQFEHNLVSVLPMVSNSWVADSLDSWKIDPETPIDVGLSFGPIVGHAIRLLERQKLLTTKALSDTNKQGIRIRIWDSNNSGASAIDEVSL